MFQSGDIVLYRFNVSQIKQIKQEKKQTYYLLHSLGADYCEYKVPYENIYGHIQSLPSEQELDFYLKQLETLTYLEIPRNPGLQYYQNILNSMNLLDWFILLKTIYHNQLLAKEKGRRLNQKQKLYYELILEKLATIYAFVLHQSIVQCKTLLEQTLKQDCELN